MMTQEFEGMMAREQAIIESDYYGDMPYVMTCAVRIFLSLTAHHHSSLSIITFCIIASLLLSLVNVVITGR